MLFISAHQLPNYSDFPCNISKTRKKTATLILCLKTIPYFPGVMGEYEPKIEVHFPFTVTAAKGTTVKMECFALGK